MAVWAIVPVKPLFRGKSRLSSVLNEEQRTVLNHCLLENTIEVLTSIPEIQQVLVISRDPKALTLARSLKARTIQEAGAPHLNHAIGRATHFANHHAVSGVLIVPADLPLINSVDIQKILDLAGESPEVIVVPDRHRKGTNALFVSPPGYLTYQYGENSFQLHTEQALVRGANLKIADIPTLSLDLDYPADLEEVRNRLHILSKDKLTDEIFHQRNSENVDSMGVSVPNKPCLQQIIP